MPASSGDFYNAFYDWTGHHGSSAGDSGNRVGGWNEWRDVFHSIGGVDFSDMSASQEKQMFSDFLVAFYPSEGLTRDEWEELRYDFYADWDIDDVDDFDWEAWRRAMGY